MTSVRYAVTALAVACALVGAAPAASLAASPASGPGGPIALAPAGPAQVLALFGRRLYRPYGYGRYPRYGYGYARRGHGFLHGLFVGWLLSHFFSFGGGVPIFPLLLFALVIWLLARRRRRMREYPGY